MSIDVYWSPVIDTNIVTLSPYTFSEPSNVLADLNIPMFRDTQIMRCPSFVETLKNTYCVKSPVDCLIHYNDNVQEYQQEGIENLAAVRNPNHQMFSLQIWYNFVSEVPLEMEVKQATYHKNNFTDKTMLIGGTVNIGKYYRGTECAFHIRNKHDRIELLRDDALFYIKFKTKENIKLRRYSMTEELTRYVNDTVRARKSVTGRRRSLEYYYDMFMQSKYDKKIIKLVKENLLE